LATEQSMLQKAQAVATILAALAIPLILASTGYYVQKNIADDSLKKDYLNMALEILRSGGENTDPEIKAWATNVVTEFSPVPFTTKAAMELNSVLYLRPMMPNLPEIARQPDLDALCDPSCLMALTERNRKWSDELEAAGSDGVVKVMEMFSEAVAQTQKLAHALELSQIAGQACERAYDAVQEINNRP